MIRWLISLVCICLVWAVGINEVAIAQTSSTPTIPEKQLKQGEKTAQKAIEAANEGDFVQAEKYWTELIEDFPDNPAVWTNRGNIRVSQNKLDEAIADFNQSIEIADRYPDPYLNRGIAYEGKKLWQNALDDYNRVLAINPQDAMAYNNRGNAKAGQENWPEALTDYLKAVEIAPDFALARANAALMTYQVGDRPSALKQMRKLVRRYPMFPDMRAALTAVLWTEGQQGEAESNWVAAVGIDNRYQDLDWVKNIRRWPPQMVEALEKFLTLN